MKPKLPGSLNPTPTFREEETLLTCVVCHGSGRKFKEDEKGCYFCSDCIWCNGLGMITKTQFRAWKELRPEVQKDILK